jgi:CTP:molybdopterin cytidylyltransferase MocA
VSEPGGRAIHGHRDRVAAVVLAAGAGSRFAGPGHKLLASLRGRPLVAWAVEHAMAAALDEVFVVVGEGIDVARAVPPGATVIKNDRWAGGVATSLAAAIAAARAGGHGAIVVGLGDQPFVGPSAWQAVAAADETPIAIATYEGVRANPVRLASAVWHQLPTLGDEGARRLSRNRPELVTEVPCAGSAVDIDTVEDLAAWS